MIASLRRVLAASFLLLLCAGAAASAETPGVQPDLDAFFTAAYTGDGPGAAVLVVQKGEVLLRRGYGLADLERTVANEPDMVFRIGSITKQFTAVAIMMLAEEGKLTVSDPIEKYLPDFPTQGRTVTLEHLLTHTSGLMSYTDLPEVMDNAHIDRSVEEIIDTFKDQEFHFEPGTQWAYCNSGYFLLGAVIEAVSGVSYAEFIQTRIFDALQMTGSTYGDFQRIIPRRVLGYHRNADGFVNAPFISMTLPYAAGSLLSTVDDLHRWDRAMLADELVSRETRERMWTPYVLAGGEATQYGYGWMLGSYDGDPVIMHGGGIHGFSTFTLTVPERDIFVAMLSNDPGNPRNPQNLAQQAVALVSGEPLPVVDETVEQATLEKYVGVYRIDDETTRVVTVVDGVLHTQRSGGSRLPASPLSPTEFFYSHSLSRFRFELDDDGQVVGMHMKPWGLEEEPAELTDEPIPTGPEVADVDPAIYDRYVGVYELMPGFEATVTRDGDRLMLQATGQPQLEVYPSSETEFFLTVVEATIEFVVDDGEAQARMMVLRQGGSVLEGERMK